MKHRKSPMSTVDKILQGKTLPKNLRFLDDGKKPKKPAKKAD